ncbi:hypothetical protein ACDZ28_04025 [Paenibacillus sp. RS8]
MSPISTPLLLLQALKDHLQALVSDNAQVKPTIHVGFLPPKDKDNENISEFPFIIIRPHVGKDQQDNSKITVKLVFGTKSEDPEGFMDLFGIMEQVRFDLQSRRIINRRFKMDLPYDWEFFEEQPYPEWYGQATTIWTLPAIQEEGLL